MRLRSSSIFALRFGLLCVFWFAVMGMEAWVRHSALDINLLLDLIEKSYTHLPMVLGVAIGTFGGELRLRAVGVGVVLVTLAMVATDLAPATGRRMHRTEILRNPSTEEVFLDDVSSSWTAPGALMMIFEHRTGAFEGVDSPTQVVRTDQPRYQLFRAYVKAYYLLGPIIVAGFVLGALSWLRRNILFRSRSAELVAGFLIGWTLGPFVAVTAIYMGEQFNRDVLFSGTPYHVIFLPYLTLLAIAALGWKSASDSRP